MFVYDENGNALDDVDYDNGKVVEKSKVVKHVWVVDHEEEYEIEVIRQYPSGACDTMRKTTRPEIGHWETFDDEGMRLEWDRPIPDDWKSVGEVVEEVPYGLFMEYSDEEKAMRDLVLGGRLVDIESGLADADDAVCLLYEMHEAHSAIIDDQDAAICALYEMMEA